MTENRPDIAAAVARMGRTTSVGREVRALETVVGRHETVEQIVRGTDGVGFGVLVLTDHRLLFFRQGFTSRRVEDFVLGAVSSVAWTVRRGEGALTVVTDGQRFVLQAVGAREGAPFVDALRARTAQFRPAPAAAPLPHVAGPVLHRHAAFPTLLRSTRDGRPEHYLVADPALVTERHRVEADGSVHRVLTRPAEIGFSVAAVVVPAILLGLLAALAYGAAGFWTWTVIGGVVALAAVARWGEQLDRLRAGLLLCGPDGATVRVEPANRQAWEMCQIAEGLLSTQAWPQRLIDDRRHVPELLWGAVRRSVQLDAELADVRRAEAHDSLRQIARQNGERIAAERAVLDSVRANLRSVLDVAVRVDQRAVDRAAAARAEQEQQELRGRLLGTQGFGTEERSHDHADAAAGLAAESHEIDRLLAAADRMLS